MSCRLLGVKVKIKYIEVTLGVPGKSLWFKDYELIKRVVIPGEDDLLFAYNTKEDKYRYAIGKENGGEIEWVCYSKEEIYCLFRGLISFGTLYG